MQFDSNVYSGAQVAELDVWTAPGTPVCIAYERGYADALEFAVGEIARLREEIASLKEHPAESAH